MAPLIAAVVIALFAILIVASSVRIVRQARVGIVERWGKYRVTLAPGLHLLVPMLDRITAVVDMRETVQAFAPQPVITQDNVTIGIDIVVYYQVTDPFRATYEVASVLIAMEQLAITTLRNVVGAMTLEETLTSRDSINTQLRIVLDEATENWGARGGATGGGGGGGGARAEGGARPGPRAPPGKASRRAEERRPRRNPPAGGGKSGDGGPDRWSGTACRIRAPVSRAFRGRRWFP